MNVDVTIRCADGAPLPPGSSVTVEVRDTSLADAPAVRLHRASATVPGAGETMSVSVPLTVDAVPDGTTVWAHVDVDGDGRVSRGDYVSVESHAIASTPRQSMTIRVKQVG